MYRNDQPPAITLEHLTKKFSEATVALDDVSLDVPAGQRLVLLGKSGSGKSTLLRHINRLQKPTSGRVLVHGRDIGKMSRREVNRTRQRVAFIFQGFFLVGNMTALENVCTGMLSYLRGPRMGLWMYPKHVRAEAMRLLDRVGIADQAYQRADTLSGGQQQRVAIARALMQKPSILCADEPVASLDPDTSREVLDLITAISAEEQLTVIMTLHQVGYALEFGERIIGLRNGKLVFDKEVNGETTDTVMRIYRDEEAEIVQLPTSVAQFTQHAPVNELTGQR